MKPQFARYFLGALALLPLQIPAAYAQPDVQNAPKADNPLNRAVRPNFNNMAPEERMKELMRRQWMQMGVASPAMQDALSLYVAGETTARQTLSEKARALQTGLRGNVLPDTQIATLLNDYVAALEEDKTRRETAFAALKKTVDLTKMPKVEAMLTLMGLANDAPILAQGNAMGALRGLGQRGGLGLQNGAGGLNGGLFGPQPTMPRLNRRRNLPEATPPAPATPATPPENAVI